jgi:hypothetical protein
MSQFDLDPQVRSVGRKRRTIRFTGEKRSLQQDRNLIFFFFSL